MKSELTLLTPPWNFAVVQMDDGMSLRVERLRTHGELDGAQLAPGLAKLAAAEIVETPQGMFLESLLPRTLGSAMFPDQTGFEAVVSKIHIEDFLDELEPRAEAVLLQGLLYGERLAAKLAARGGRFRVYLCVDDESNDVTCRFHSLRAGEVWFVDDPNAAVAGSVAIWKWAHDDRR